MAEAISRAVRQRAKAELYVSELIGNKMKENQGRYAKELLDKIFIRGITPGDTVKCNITFEFSGRQLMEFISGKVQEKKQNKLPEELFEI